MKIFNVILLFLVLNCSTFAQDSINYHIDKWSIDAFMNKNYKTIDSSLQNFQVYNPTEENTPFFSSLGNIGSATQNNIFSQRQENPFLFIKNYSYYLYTPQNLFFYNTHQAYTQTKYITNFSKRNSLQNIQILHTQNINPYTNIGLQYRLSGAHGEYEQSQTRNHALRFFTSYEGHNYNAYASYQYNKLNNYVNGGILNDSMLANEYYINSSYIPTRLQNFKQQILNRNIYLNHAFIKNKIDTIHLNDSLNYKKHIPIFKIGHILNINYFKRAYQNTGGNLYAHIITNPETMVYDSTALLTIHNSFYGQLLSDNNKWVPQINIGYRNEWEQYYSLNHKNLYVNHVLFSQIEKQINTKWYWKLYSEWDIAGGNKNDFLSSIQINYSPKKGHKISLFTSIEQQNPDVFLNQYFSHYFSWQNNFDKQKKECLKLNYQYKNLEIGTDIIVLNRFIYISSLIDSALYIEKINPKQATQQANIISAFIRYKFHIGPLYIDNSFIYQKSSSEEFISIPNLNFYNSSYFKFYLFKKVLKVNIGTDIRYNSPYYISAYDPATGFFFQQNSQKMGNYPYVNFFVNMKLKRALFFFKLEHLNHGFSGYQYFSVMHYPQNPRVFRFGLSWRFYN